MKEFWNERFAQNGFVYGKEPNTFLKSELKKIKEHGKALFPLEGEGRNACFAAEHGWEVDAFDFSEAGRMKAEELCQTKGVSISYNVAKIEDFHFTAGKYDLIALIYAHVNPELRNYLHKKATESLKTGGRIVLEAFHPKQLKDNFKSGGPKSFEMLYTSEMIRNDFKNLSHIYTEELEIELAEGEFHVGKGFVTRFTGVK